MVGRDWLLDRDEVRAFGKHPTREALATTLYLSLQKGSKKVEKN